MNINSNGIGHVIIFIFLVRVVVFVVDFLKIILDYETKAVWSSTCTLKDISIT